MKLSFNSLRLGVVIEQNKRRFQIDATKVLKDTRQVEIEPVRFATAFVPILDANITTDPSLTGQLLLFKFQYFKDDFTHSFASNVHTLKIKQAMLNQHIIVIPHIYPPVTPFWSNGRTNGLLGQWLIKVAVTVTPIAKILVRDELGNWLAPEGGLQNVFLTFDYADLASFQWDVVIALAKRVNREGYQQQPNPTSNRVRSLDDM